MATHTDERSQFKLTECRKTGICRLPIDQATCTRGFANQKVRIAYTHTFMEGKVCISWKTKFWSKVFGPWYFDPWYFDPWYWSKASGSRY